MQKWHIRILWAIPIFLVITVVASLTIIIASKVAPKKTPAVFHFVKHHWSKAVLALMNVQLIESETSRRAFLASGVSHVIIAPHRCILDPLIVAAILPKHKNQWVVKQEVFKIPVIGPALKAAGCLGTARSGDKEEAIALLDGTADQLRAGNQSLVFFPSGTRKRSEFKKGPFHYAKANEMPVMPIGIEGAAEILSVGTWWKGAGGSIVFDILDAFWCKDMSVDEARNHAQQLVG